MLILKIGGSVITNKTTDCTARPDIIRHIADILAQFTDPLILIHGAGSFGHTIAKKHNLQHGNTGESGQQTALAQLQRQLIDLNNRVVEALNQTGRPALTVHPASMCMMEAGRITDFFMESVQHVLAQNLVPVLYGDCVRDKKQGFGILSGDQLAVYLARELKVSRMAFGTNVDGVLDLDGNPYARLNTQTLGSIAEYNTVSGQADVTGGMLGKLAEIARLKGTRTRIFNLSEPENLKRILSGDETIGTLIEGKEL